MEKQIKNKNNIFRILTEEGYCSDNVHITKAILNGKELEKTITFSIWDDMLFSADIISAELYSSLTELSFEIDIDDQIYFSLNRMLGVNNIFIIDDDNTRKILQNYLVFKRDNDKIIITFYDKDIDKPLFERFKIFIKNVSPDLRSKIKDYNVKYRLLKFFREATEILINENHQYTLDECFELLKQQGMCDGENPFISKTNKYFKNSCESCYNCVADCNKEKKIDYWCESYIPLSNKKANESCETCEYSLSQELIDSIISENSEYKDLTYEEIYEKIGYCELIDSIEIPRKLGYWCPAYLKKDSEETVKKLVPKI